MMTSPVDPLRDSLIREMKEVFGTDQRRIDHALEVLGYAERILAGLPTSSTGSLRSEHSGSKTGQAGSGQSLGADPVVVTAAAILHDIGIAEAERKHGSAAARFQELEGPPIARRILQGLPIDEGRIDHICRIIASHHSAGDIDTPEFRIIWDADRLGNAAHECPKRDRATVTAYINRMFRTDAGRSLAERVLLEGGDKTPPGASPK